MVESLLGFTVFEGMLEDLGAELRAVVNATSSDASRL